MGTRGRKTWSDNLPATKQMEVTPDDSDLLPAWGRAVLITGDGDIELQLWDDEDGSEITYPVVAGQILPVRPKRIMGATDATCVLLGG